MGARRFSCTKPLQSRPSSPTVSPLPPIITEEPSTRTRNFYVHSGDVDPAAGGFEFISGCKGCSAIINGKRPVAHSSECRLRVMQQAPNSPKIAARVKRTVDKDHEFHAKNLEEEEEAKREKESPAAPMESATTAGDWSAGASRALVLVSASSGSPSVTPTSTPRNRGAEDPPGSEAVPQDSSTSAGADQDDFVDPLARPGGIKRLREEYPEDGYQTTEEANQQRINLVEDLVEAMEDDATKNITLGGEIRMRICE